MRSSQGEHHIFKTLQNKYIRVEFLIWEVLEGGTILIWGYTEEYKPDSGVCEYQKVENPCSIVTSLFTYHTKQPILSHQERSASKPIVNFKKLLPSL
jgi:hypothetical protein